jgi:YHS domain-containing protein
MRGQYKQLLCVDQIRDQYGWLVARMTESLDEGRVSFGNRDEIELATATDPVCGMELKRADAAAAIDRHGQVYFFCSLTCRDAFLADPDRYVAR